jgi:hypothetical protein
VAPDKLLSEKVMLNGSLYVVQLITPENSGNIRSGCVVTPNNAETLLARSKAYLCVL